MSNLSAFSRHFFRNLFSRARSPGIMVLDNYHEAPEDSPLHEILLYGFTEIPQGINVVIVSRTDLPSLMARLRTSDKLHVLTWDDLRLTPEESMCIRTLRKKETISKKALQSLHSHTGGWVAGLVLLIEYSRNSSIPEGLKDKANQEVIFDYFAGEVLRFTDDKTREFLLKTAFLPSMTVYMAEKLTGIPGSDHFFISLMRKNYFIYKRAGPESTYEYHPLFREFLLAQGMEIFPPDEIADIQRTAARLLGQSGQIEESASLYKQLGDWQSLSQLILRNAQTLSVQGRYVTLQNWLCSLPVQRLEEDPWHLFWLGACRSPFNPIEARQYYKQAFEGFRQRQDVCGLYLSWSGISDTFVYYWEDFKPLDRWITALEEVLGQYPEFPSKEVEARVLCAAIGAFMFRQPQHPSLPEWTDRATVILSQPINVGIRLSIAGELCHYYSWLGDIPRFGSLIQIIRMMEHSTEGMPFASLMRCVVEAIWGWITATWDHSEKAIDEGLKAAEKTGIHLMDSNLLTQGVYCHASAGNLEAAESYLARIAPLLCHEPRLNQGHYHYLAGWVSSLRGDSDRAYEHAILGLRSTDECGAPFPEAVNCLSMAQISFDIGERQQAAGYLKKGIPIARNIGSHHLLFHGHCLDAYFAFKTDKESKGISALRRALKISRKAGLMNYPWWRPDVMTYLCIKALENHIEVEYVQALIRKRNLFPRDPPLHLDNWPWPVRIYTLGRFSLLHEGKTFQFSGKTQKRPLELLKTLIAFSGRQVHIEQLADILWPDAEGGCAYQAITMALQRLRKLLGDKQVINLSEGRLSLNPLYCWLDVWAFERLLGQDMVDPERFQSAINLYHGPFLRDDINASWAISMRARLNRKFLRAISALGQHWESQGELPKAIACYERGLDVDDLNEDFYYHLMQCYDRSGQRTEALKSYHQCRKMLNIRLGIAPSDRTDSLYNKLRQNK